MRAPMPEAKWWGWGDPARSDSIGSLPELRAFLRDALDLPEGIEPLRVPDPESIRLPTSRLAAEDAGKLRGIVGQDAADNSPMTRLSHAYGKAYRDLVRLRLGDVAAAPDVVLFPGSESDIGKVLAFCAERGIAVVPFGGGTSVVGGVEVADPARPHVTLDLRRMARLLGVDGTSLTATAEAGILGPALEAHLAAQGVGLGHFPQSFEYSTLGGWIASRSTGAFSNRYGKIEDLVVDVRLFAPTGIHDLHGRPRHAMGPDLLSLAVGSEGTLGVITRATVRVHRTPEARKFESVLFPGFGVGLEALRGMAQEGVPADLAYLDDEDETRLSVAAAGGGKKTATALLRARGIVLDRAALAYFGYEGSRLSVSRRFGLGRAYWRPGVAAGPGPAERWMESRFVAPYVRDSLIENRVLVDTVETAALWSNVERVHGGVRAAFHDAVGDVPGWIGCHISHTYSEGASLYFTFMARQRRGEELAQYDAVKRAVTRAILDCGGQLSHHHGIGSEHAPYFREAIGEENWRLLRELKRAMDPRGIMNPGKLFPVSA